MTSLPHRALKDSIPLLSRRLHYIPCHLRYAAEHDHIHEHMLIYIAKGTIWQPLKLSLKLLLLFLGLLWKNQKNYELAVLLKKTMSIIISLFSIEFSWLHKPFF